MSFEQFEQWDPKPETLAVVAQANEIINSYREQGYSLTLRQLYYQFVARDLIPNTERAYKRIGEIVNRGRMAGLIDWDMIEDRTRNLAQWRHYDSPLNAIEEARKNYNVDWWENQPCRIEVWIEKEALSGVIEGVCGRNDVPYFSCRGYVSQSEQYAAGKRHYQNFLHSYQTIVIHLGDHDPSGIDMTRDNHDRLWMFSAGQCTVRRIALNWDQVQEYGPPPNPAKVTDSRFEKYRAEFGDESWELDALEPAVIEQLITDTIAEYRDTDLWAETSAKLVEHKATLDSIIEDLSDE